MRQVVFGSERHTKFLTDALKRNREGTSSIEIYRNNESSIKSFFVKEQDKDFVYIVACAPEEYENTLKTFESLGVKHVLLVNPALYLIHHFELFNFSKLLLTPSDWRNSLDYVEFHVTDNCNLNCKGCSHLCNLVKGRHDTDFDKWKKDLSRLRQLVKDVYIIRILGGEPFLNEKLPDFVEYTRKTFDSSEIHVVTNSLLLDRVPNRTFDIIRKNDVIIDVSYYPVLDRNKTVALLSEKRVKFRMSEEKTSFFSKNIDESGSNNIKESYDACINHGCHFMHNGRICTCAMPLLSHYYNGKFGSHILPENEGIDLYDSSLHYGSLRSLLDLPIDACRFCSPKQESFEWKGHWNSPEKSDWVIGL